MFYLWYLPKRSPVEENICLVHLHAMSILNRQKKECIQELSHFILFVILSDKSILRSGPSSFSSCTKSILWMKFFFRRHLRSKDFRRNSLWNICQVYLWLNKFLISIWFLQLLPFLLIIKIAIRTVSVKYFIIISSIGIRFYLF